MQAKKRKSHGLCLDEPDANLPAGEVYLSPGAEGQFPDEIQRWDHRLHGRPGWEDRESNPVEWRPAVIDAHNAKLSSDPVTGVLGELGFGTQTLPVSGKDIQDEKILGTMHVANITVITSRRSDSRQLAKALNATHDDILFSPSKTPEINVSQVRMIREGGHRASAGILQGDALSLASHGLRNMPRRRPQSSTWWAFKLGQSMA